MHEDNKKVLILGGGFAGLEAAIHLRKEDYKVTLVSERDYFYIYPTSIWIPVHKASFEDVSIPIHELAKVHGFEVIIDGVRNINTQEHTITLSSGVCISDYNDLIIALGASKMQHKGIENTLSICGAPEQSLAIRDKIDALVEKGHGKVAMGFGGNPKDTTSVRGGPGFELMFNLHNYLKKKGIRDNFELTFFAPMPKPGARMGDQALKAMDMMFQKANLKKHFGKKIKEFSEKGVVFEDDSTLASDFTMFIPAGDGHHVVKSSDLPINEAGFVLINNYCQVMFNGVASENIYAIGDVAALEGPDWRAKQGHVAEVMARNTAFNIIAKDKDLRERKGYIEHLNILCVMDSGDGAGFVFRDDKRAMMLPMPIVGHWLKKGWGNYCRLSKLNKIPRIPGM